MSDDVVSFGTNYGPVEAGGPGTTEFRDIIFNSARPRVLGHKRNHQPLSPIVGRAAPTDGWQAGCVCGWTYGPVRSKRECADAHRKHLATTLPKCGKCNKYFSIHMMSKATPHLCKECIKKHIADWNDKNPGRQRQLVRKHHLKVHYGITPDEYAELLRQQLGRCAICKRDGTDSRGYSMHVDHCHKTGKVRGILCNKCNQGMGNLRDDVNILYAAILYLIRGGSKKIAMPSVREVPT